MTSLRDLCNRAIELDGKATNGPWQHINHSDTVESWAEGENRSDYNCPDVTSVNRYNNAALIAEYRELCPEIARKALVLERQLETAMKALIDVIDIDARYNPSKSPGIEAEVCAIAIAEIKAMEADGECHSQNLPAK